MKLLIVTQKVDKNDPILGFFHSWIEEFAKHVEQLTVISQQTGEYHFPSNVSVVSLGKERGVSKISQIFSFWKAQWRLRKSYDTVFVHMTPIWVVLGVFIWKILRKPMYLWYEARGGGWALPLSLHFVRNVFGATAYGLPQKTNKHIILGHGIDTNQFAMGVWSRDTQSIIAIGRITHTKRLDSILTAFAALPSNTRLLIAGGTITQSDLLEWKKLQQQMIDLGIQNRVEVKWIARSEMPTLLGQAGLLIHACEGGLDKAILEAMSCGCPLVSSSTAARDVLPAECIALPENLTQKTAEIYALPQDQLQKLGNTLRDTVVLQHSLSKLIQNLCTAMQKS